MAAGIWVVLAVDGVTCGLVRFCNVEDTFH